jgi:hypothetical protein
LSGVAATQARLIPRILAPRMEKGKSAKRMSRLAANGPPKKINAKRLSSLPSAPRHKPACVARFNESGGGYLLVAVDTF